VRLFVQAHHKESGENCSGKRNGVPAGAIVPGVNFRLSELHGAVVLAQLGKREAILVMS